MDKYFGIPLEFKDLAEIGIQTPIIHKKNGKTKSPTVKPFHVACSIHQYFPAPSLTNIIKTILILKPAILLIRISEISYIA